MGRKTISFSLDSASIQKAIREVQEYKAQLQRKNEILIDRLSKIGLQVVQSTMESIPDDEKGSYYTEIVNNSAGDITGAAIRLSGDKILFLEFSAGIVHGIPPGGYPLPSGSEYGYGTYPGQTHALSVNGWWYTDENGEKHHSYGNRAYMPMFRAEQAIILAVRETAREVFSS